MKYFQTAYAWCSERARTRDIARLVKFGLVGLSGVAVGLGSLRLFIGELGLLDVLAQVCSFILSATNNFIWNQVWTFGDRPREHCPTILLKRWLSFLLAYSVGFGVNLGIFLLLKRGFHVNYMWAAVCAAVVSTPINFLVSNFWVWRLPSEKPQDGLPKEH